MKFSTRTVYGLKAVLVLAGRYGEGSLSVSQIAKKQGISVPYLEQILNALKKKGLVKSVRGPQGGYILARTPAEITLKQLFEALVAKNALFGASPASVSADADEATLANALFWKKFSLSLANGLGDTTLKALLDEARGLKKHKSRSPYTFQI